MDWSKAFTLEMNVADIISQQSKRGVQFDKKRAAWHVYSLSEKIVDIDIELIPLLPKMLNVGSTYQRPFTTAGKLQKYPQLYADRMGLTREEIGGPFSCVWYSDFDCSKTDKVKHYMLSNGWLPTEWNTKDMKLNVWKYRRKLESKSYKAFIESLNKQEADYYDTLVSAYIKAHFVDKSVHYMRAYLSALRFPIKGKVPTFADIKKRLLLTPKWPSSPKITEDSFESVSEESGHALKLLKDRMVWSHRRSLLIGLISQVREDGRLEAQANPCATPTARMRHRIVVNIPAAGATFGKECRSLFHGYYDPTVTKPTLYRKSVDKEHIIPHTNLYYEMDGDKKKIHKLIEYIPKGRHVFVGYDGAGLELRMLCHYMIYECLAMKQEALDEGDSYKLERAEAGLKSAYIYRDVLLNGDIHTHNQKLAGLPTRNAAKTFIYGFNYGAGDAKLGTLVNGGQVEGAKIRETFLRENPCIAILIERMQEKGKVGWLPGLDGRKLFLRVDDNGDPQVHKALNLTLQSAGAIVMKYAMCFLKKDVIKHNIRGFKVLDVHDEGQWSCHPDDVEKTRELMSVCVKKAGEYLGMECPLESDSLCGANWYSTH